MAMEPQAAELLGAQALGFLAERPEEMGRFLTITGVDLDVLRSNAGAPELLAAVLDFLRGDEELASAFCAAAEITPEKLTAARAALPGGDVPHWT
ncbi:MAG: DUF3572 domain-containing protein [Rhodobacteraceae bacterium]|nr:DUF3572 domain-containing protein [Paracoccaceae bacterium]